MSYSEDNKRLAKTLYPCILGRLFDATIDISFKQMEQVKLVEKETKPVLTVIEPCCDTHIKKVIPNTIRS